MFERENFSYACRKFGIMKEMGFSEKVTVECNVLNAGVKF